MRISKRGTSTLSETLMGSILVLAAILAILLVLRIIMCKSGAWSGGIC